MEYTGAGVAVSDVLSNGVEDDDEDEIASVVPVELSRHPGWNLYTCKQER